MAMKTNFEESSVISSPFVDEIANQTEATPRKSRTDEENREASLTAAIKAAAAGTAVLTDRGVSAALARSKKAAAQAATPQPRPERAQPRGIIQIEAERQRKIREATPEHLRN